MPRPLLLFTGPWADLPIEEVAARAAEWGYTGLDLCTWGDHFEVQRATSEEEYTGRKLETLRRHGLDVQVLSAHRVSQAVCDRIDERHRALVPDYVWGDGEPAGVQARATEEMIATVVAAQQLGAMTVAGFTGSPIWSYVVGYPPPSASVVQNALRDFAHRFAPILEACRNAGLRYACEVHPGQLAYDYYSAEMLLDAVEGQSEFGFLLDPSHLHWQGVDPVQFIRRFGERIFHVHVKDVAITLDGRSGLLGSYLPYHDGRRGWHPRSPGRGGLDWEGIIRALNAVGYEGALSVEWSDPAMDRMTGAAEACQFVKRLDFDPAPRKDGGVFR
jgi:sugar phosphate isomerase/epimerase